MTFQSFCKLEIFTSDALTFCSKNREVLSKLQYNQYYFSNTDEIYKLGIFIASWIIAAGFLFSSETVATEFNRNTLTYQADNSFQVFFQKFSLYYLSKLVKGQDGSYK